MLRATSDNDISVYLAKAEESLATADSEYANRRYNSCANRCYDACIHAAIAALLAAGVRPAGSRRQWSHEFVQAEFVGRLTNQRKVYSPELRTVLQENLKLRHVADYTTDRVTEIQARRALSRSSSFVQSILQRRGDQS